MFPNYGIADAVALEVAFQKLLEQEYDYFGPRDYTLKHGHLRKTMEKFLKEQDVVLGASGKKLWITGKVLADLLDEEDRAPDLSPQPSNGV